MGRKKDFGRISLKDGLGGARVLIPVAVFFSLASAVSPSTANESLYYDNSYAEEEEAPLAAKAVERVPMPRVTIYPNDVITDDMLEDRELPLGSDRSAAVFKTREGLLGKVSRQTLLPNAPIALSAVREPYAIKVGQPAVVVFKSGPLVISGTAVPLQPGSVGETIALRNVEAGTTIRGVVQSDGTVRVGER